MAGGKRVFWTDEEKGRIGVRMHEVLTADPTLSLIQAVRLAQQVLPEDRQREIIAWSVVQANIEPKLEEARAAGSAAVAASSTASEPSSAVSTDEPAVAEVAQQAGQQATEPHLAEELAATAPSGLDQQEAPVESVRSASVPLRQSVAVANVDPLQLEAAWLVALQSPAVEACLVDLFGRAMAKAFSRLSSDQPEARVPDTGPVADARVLLAGFPASAAKSLEDALSGLCEVRTWQPGQSQQLFETTARICRLAVIPEGMPDDAEDFLRSLSLKVLRHEGGTARLVEKVQDALA